MSGVEKPGPRRPLLADLNPHLMCILCGGYFVDAAAIIECLHTFCKSCLVRYLETNKYCPICDVQVHKTRPLQNIRPDPTLQDMVYKMVPGLYHKEMKIRREFYSKCPNAPPSSLEDRGDLPPELSSFYAPDELVNLVLKYCPPGEDDESTGNNKELQNKRYLRCPAAVKITHLEKLLRNKYGLDNRYNIELMFDDSKLSPDLSLMEVAYAFGRKRKGQFLFTYRIYDSQCKKMRLSCDSDEDMRPASPLPNEAVKDEGEKAPSVATVLSSAETTATTATSSASVVQIVSVPVTSAPPVSISVTSVTTPAPPITASPVTIIPVTTAVTSVTTSTTSSRSATPVTSSAPPVTTFAIPTTISITPLTIPLIPVTVPTPPVTTTVTTSAPTAPVSTSASVAPALTIVVSSAGISVSQSASSVTTVTTATVKTASTPSLQAKKTASEKTAPSTTVPSIHSPATPTDGKSKLDSIISRLGDPSKHARPESNTVNAPATPKQDDSAKETQGKEVQLRISENGVMKFTSMGHLDKHEKVQTAETKVLLPPPNPFPKPSTKVGHSVKVTEKSSNSESAPKQGAVAPVSPNIVASPRKVTPIGYKTLKAGPKTWNPSISRNSFLSAKLEQQQQQLQKQAEQNKDSPSSGTGTKSSTESVAKPPRFFKARNNAPRYLGNPASGVKPMYKIVQYPPPVAQKPPAKQPPKPPAVLKICPRTLTPIITSASAVVSSSPSQIIQAKDRPPFLSTTISGASNHTPSSRCVTTTSSTVTESLQSNSSSKLSSDLAMRSPTNLAYQNHMRYLPFCDPLNPFAPRLPDAGVNRMPTPPYPNMLRPPFAPLLVNSYKQCRPPVGILFNQPLHRQLNLQGPHSPVPGLPSPIPQSPAPLSPSSAPKTVIPPAHWAPGGASPSSPVHQSKVPMIHQPPSKSPTSKSLPSRVTDDQTKVNGEKPQLKDKSATKTEEPTVQSGAEKEIKADETRPPDVKEDKSREQDNNNTVVVDKKSVTANETVKDQSKPQSQQLSHNISKLCSTTPAGKELPSSGVENSPVDQAAAVTK